MFRKVIFMALLAGAVGAYLIARKVAQEEGKTMVEALPQVPEQARRVYGDVKVRVKDAAQAGKEAATVKQQEIQDYLEGHKVSKSV